MANPVIDSVTVLTQAAATSISVSTPGTLADGDTVLLSLTIAETAPGTIVWPTGFTQLYQGGNTYAGMEVLLITAVQHNVTEADEGASWTASWTVSKTSQLVATVVRSADGNTALKTDQSVGDSTSTALASNTTLAVTPTANALVVASISATDDDGSSWPVGTTLNGFTEYLNIDQGECGMAVYTKGVASGSSGSVDCTTGGGGQEEWVRHTASFIEDRKTRIGCGLMSAGQILS